MDEALAENNLTISQYAVLSHLREESSSLSNAELARRSFVTAPTMLRIVQDLEKLRFIERAGSKVHNRVVDIMITHEGEQILRQCDSVVQSIQEEMLLDLNEADIACFSKFLASCAERLELRGKILLKKQA
jgi:Transcriptional regulators